MSQNRNEASVNINSRLTGVIGYVKKILIIPLVCVADNTVGTPFLIQIKCFSFKFVEICF